MTTRPTPGQSYPDRWNDSEWHPYTKMMDVYRFKEIRSALKMSQIVPEGTNIDDALYKVRPLLNVLKKTLGLYMDCGSELSLDESSIACRSKYGRSLIFYNNTKPTGKYHFRFYVVTDTDYFAALRIRVHTRNDSDEADGIPLRRSVDNVNLWKSESNGDNDDEEEDDGTPKLVKLVLDMARPWFNTGRVMNMDNYYTSPQAFIELRQNGMFARGTCRSNRKNFPKCVQYTRPEAKTFGRGAMKVSCNQTHGMVAFGWVDGNPVHFLTTADGTESSTVRRRVQSQIKTVRAPVSIKRYNHGMMGVDRVDQLISLYSMAKTHAFKKYYNKLTMGLLDFALTNAEIHYFISNPTEKKRKNHRYSQRIQLCNEIFEMDWNNYSEVGSPIFNEQLQQQDNLRNDNDELQYSVTKHNQQATHFSMAPAEQLFSTEDESMTCSPTGISAYIKRTNKSSDNGISYGGAYCQICFFEGRGQKSRNVVICGHGIRCCSVASGRTDTDFSKKALVDESTKNWFCRNQSTSCLEKFHYFYLPKGLFGTKPILTFKNNGCPRSLRSKRTSTIYKQKMQWMLENGMIEKMPSVGGRKRKTNVVAKDDIEANEETQIVELKLNM